MIHDSSYWKDSLRKLAEAKKISDAKFQKSLRMQSYQATGKIVDLLNNHRIESLYQLGNGISITKPLSYVANQLIHSFIFVPVFEPAGRIQGIAFNSDRSKNNELYMLELRSLVEALAACADSYIIKASYFRLDNGELEVIVEDDL